MKKNLCFIFILLLWNCGYPILGIKTYTLKNGYSKVAKKSYVYHNKFKFEKSILHLIDTTVIYEEFEKKIHINNKEITVNTIARKNHDNPYKNYGAYRFYNNGNFNYFTLSRENDTLKENLFNPTYSGNRGVFYTEMNLIKGDLITRVSGAGAIGIRKEIFTFKGDTLFVTVKSHAHIRTYVKRKIPFKNLNFISNW